MARSFFPLVLAVALPLGAVKSEPSPAPTAAPSASPGDENRPRRPGPGRDDDDPAKWFRQKLEQMDPKDREHFRENWQRWKEMGDRERADWKKRAAAEQDRLKKSVDDAIAKTGLTLTADQREVFTLRYRQERRKIEEQLCKEMSAKRQDRIDAMLTQLKAEFSPAAAAPAKPSPTP